MCVSTAAGPFVFGSAVGEYARILGRFIWNEYRMTMGSLWDHYRITIGSLRVLHGMRGAYANIIRCEIQAGRSPSFPKIANSARPNRNISDASSKQWFSQGHASESIGREWTYTTQTTEEAAARRWRMIWLRKRGCLAIEVDLEGNERCGRKLTRCFPSFD